MERNYVTQEIFDVEIRRLDRQDDDTELRMKERISYQLGEINRQIDNQGHVLETIQRTQQDDRESTDRRLIAMYGDIRELKGEVSGLKENIEGLKHFMTWGLTLIGLLVIIAQVLAKVIQ